MRLRLFLRLVICAAALLPLSACAANHSRVPPERAFALSASALAGSDNYGFAGELSIYDALGAVVNRSHYTGKVTGHGNLRIEWSGDSRLQSGQAEAGKASTGPGDYQPLRLPEAIRGDHAAIAYADLPAKPGAVLLQLDLKPEIARRRIADGLRDGLAGLRAEWGKRTLSPDRRHQADAVLDAADKQLEATLSKLEVRTRCLWLADGKTWFPLEMTERTEIAYRRNGETHREHVEAVTRFKPAGAVVQ